MGKRVSLRRKMAKAAMNNDSLLAVLPKNKCCRPDIFDEFDEKNLTINRNYSKIDISRVWPLL